MGSILAVNFLPNVLFGIFVGVFVDRWNKKLIMLLGDIARGINVAIVAILFLSGNLEVWYLYVFTFFNSTVETIVSPARMTVIPRLVEDQENFLAANSLFKASASFAEIIGLAFSGAIIGIWGIGSALIIDSISFFLCSCFILITKIPKLEVKQQDELIESDKFKEFIVEFKEGFNVAFANPVIRLCIFLGVTLNFIISPFNVLAPIYASETLAAGPEGFSLMAVGLSGGVFIGAILIGNFGNDFSLRSILIFGILAMVISFAGYFFTENIYIAIIFSLILGASTAGMSSASSSLLMTYCPKNILGRVGSVTGSLGMAAMPLGTMLAGFIAELLLPKQVFLAIAGLLFIVLIYLSFDKTLKVSEQQEVVAEEA